MKLRRPVAWQMSGQERRPVQVAYEVRGREARFRLGKYDRKKPLVIDPVNLSISYSTLIGGAGQDVVSDIAVNAAGETWIAGNTTSADFASGAATRLSSDAFVARLNATGTAFLFVTFLGGSKTDELLALALDSAGNSVITGFTTSPDLPLVSPFQSASSGSSDAFLAKLDAAGVVSWASYLGGSNEETGFTAAFNAIDGSIAVAGITASQDLATLNPYQTAPPPVPRPPGSDSRRLIARCSSQR
jgi:hypothetical protein